MAPDPNKQARVSLYLARALAFEDTNPPSGMMDKARHRIAQTLDLLPDRAFDLFLNHHRDVAFRVLVQSDVPLGMRTLVSGPKHARQYSILLYDDQLHWKEKLFHGALLRELAHVVLEKPAPFELPVNRRERSMHIEHMEHRADALVWRWGLRDYSVHFISQTYPAQYVDRILMHVADLMLRPDPAWDE